MNAPLAACISGFVATAPMSLVMHGIHRMLPGDSAEPLPPRQIIDNIADASGADRALPSETSRNATAVAAHFAYGAATGAGYVALAAKSELHPAAEGALYGLAVWGASYLGLMPATGLYRSATEDAASRNLLMISAHLVWGATLGIAFDRLTRQVES